MSKKGDFENPNITNGDFSTKLVPYWYGFLNSTVPWRIKKLYYLGTPYLSFMGRTIKKKWMIP